MCHFDLEENEKRKWFFLKGENINLHAILESETHVLKFFIVGHVVPSFVDLSYNVTKIIN